MGRRRTRDRHLPQRVYLDHGTYWFRPKEGATINLGRDLSAALARYAEVIGPRMLMRALGDVIDRYRLEVLPLKRSAHTRADQDAQLDRLKRVFGHMLPDDVTAQHCYRYMDERRNTKGERVPVAARHEIGLLGHILGKAIRWGAGTANAVRTLEKESKSRRARYVTDAELEAVRALASERMRVAIDLAVLVGQRRGDLLDLKWSQVTPAGIEIRQGKTGAGVLIERTPALDEVLERAKRLKPDLPREYVIRNADGQPYSAAGFSANWQRLMARALRPGKHGEPAAVVERFTFHDLRAKAASDKATIEEAAALLGHASSETTKRVYKRNLTKARPVR